MSKKFYIIIAVILVLFLLCLAGYYFLLQSNMPGTNGSPANIFKNFFPFGSGTASPTVTGTSTPTQTGTQANYSAKLREIWNQPTSGFGLIDVGTETMVRHQDAATGHIYETDLFSPRQDEISDTTIPTAYNAVWGSDPASIIAQYLGSDDQTVNTYLLSIAATTATTTTGAVITTNTYTTTATALPTHIESFAVSSTTLFYLTQAQYGSTGYSSAITGGKQKQIWSSPIAELTAQFVNGTTVALTTKPYQGVSGYLYFVNTSTGAVKQILGDISGLSTLVSPDGKKVLALSQGAGSANLFVYTVGTAASQTLTPTTFPEKCVWSKQSTSILYCAIPRETLDDTSLTAWYQGTAQFTDDIWKFDLQANTGHIIENLSADSGESIDVEKPTLSDSGQYFVFINKHDGTLWSLDLNAPVPTLP